MTGKRLLLAATATVILLAPLSAAADGLRAGAQVSSGSSYGTAVGGRVEYDADLPDSGKLTLALAVDNYFPDGDGERYLEVNVHLLYTFYDGQLLDAYGGGGLGFNRHKDTGYIPPTVSKNLAINALAGFRVATGTPFVPFGEFRVDLAGQYVLTAGVLYTIK